VNFLVWMLLLLAVIFLLFNYIDMDMAARHRARFSSIHIIKVAEVEASNVRRALTKQFLQKNVQFPLPHRVIRPSSKRYQQTFAGTRPNTFA
jgi:large subunit ribosomal protein L18Ae